MAVTAGLKVADLAEKAAFSAQADGCLDATAVGQRRQVVVCGTEAHVGVQQTALELRWGGKRGGGTTTR